MAGRGPRAPAAWSPVTRTDEPTDGGAHQLTETLSPPRQGVTWSQAWFPPRPLAAVPFDWVPGLQFATPLAATLVVLVRGPQPLRGIAEPRRRGTGNSVGAGVRDSGVTEVSCHVNPAPGWLTTARHGSSNGLARSARAH